MVGALSSDLEGALCSGQVGALSSDLEGAVWLKFPLAQANAKSKASKELNLLTHQ